MVAVPANKSTNTCTKHLLKNTQHKLPASKVESSQHISRYLENIRLIGRLYFLQCKLWF